MENMPEFQKVRWVGGQGAGHIFKVLRDQDDKSPFVDGQKCAKTGEMACKS